LQGANSHQKHWLNVYDAEHRKLKNQARFIEEIIAGKLVVSKKKKAVLVQELRDRKYEAFPKDEEKKVKNEDEDVDAEEPITEEEAVNSGSDRDYDYLLSV
jgi:DNA topoisomerase-2